MVVETHQYAVQQKVVQSEFLADNLLFHKLAILGWKLNMDILGI